MNSITAEIKQKSDHTLTRGVSLNIASQPRGRALLSWCGAKSQPAVCLDGILTLPPYRNQAGTCACPVFIQT